MVVRYWPPWTIKLVKMTTCSNCWFIKAFMMANIPLSDGSVTSTASSLAKVSDDWLHPSNQSTHPSIPGQVSDEDWMRFTSFWTDVFLKGFTSSITYLILQGVVWAGITWETKMQLVKVHSQELRSVFPHVDFTNAPRHNGNIRLLVTACLHSCHRRA